MATYYYNGNKKLSARPNKDQAPKKKKELQTVGTTAPISAPEQNTDIAPVQTERTWFQKSQGTVGQTVRASSLDVGGNAAKGLAGIPEKIADAAATIFPYLLYGSGTSMLTQKQREQTEELVTKAKEKTSEFVKQDLYNEEELVAKYIVNPIEKKHGINTETMSVFGEKSDELAQSAGQMAGNVAASLIDPMLGTAMLGATSFGAEAENAFLQGANYDEAVVSAGISAGAEILTEKLSGGISLGGKTLDDLIPLESLTQGISNKLVRSLINIGVDAAGEGFEEIVSGYASAVGQKLTYMDEKELKEIFSSEEALDSFLGGAILGGISSTGKSVVDAVKGNDPISGLKDVEKAVFDKVYNDTVSEAEKGGKKLSQKEKQEIYDDVLLKLEKGYIDIDTIESVLGGETYSGLKKIDDNDTRLQKEYDSMKDEYGALNKMKTGEMTGEQNDRKEQLKKQIEEYEVRKKDANTQLKHKLREKLDSEMQGIVHGSRLAESYNERTRRGQVLEVDVETYTNESAKRTAQNLKDFGINNTNAAHDYLDLVTKVAEDRGHTFKFMTTKQLEEAVKKGEYEIEGDVTKVEGFVNGATKEIIINMDANKSLTSLVGHEITHTLASDAATFESLKNALFELAETRGEYDARLDSVKRRYSEEKGYTEEEQFNELVSDLVGDYIFGDSEFISNLSTENQNVFQKIYNEIKYLWKMATAGSKEKRQLETVKKKFEDAWRDANNTSVDQTIRYSLEQTTDGTEYVKAEKNLFLKEDGTLQSEREIFNSLVGKTFSFPDGEFKIINRLPDKDMYNELSRRRPRYEGVEDIKRLNSDVNTNMEELLSNSELKVSNEADVDNRHEKQGITSFDTRVVKFYDGTNAYEIKFSIATLKTGEKVAYAKKFFGYDDDLTKKIQASEARSKSPLNRKPVESIISQKNNNAIQNNGNMPTNLRMTSSEDNNTDIESDNEIRFSLADTVEETKDLIAVHNLRGTELLKTLELGGLPMPSVAIIKAQDGHEMYGDVTLIFPKDTIDPKADKANKVYGGDAWTPTYPKIEYKPNAKVEKKISDKYYDFANKYGHDEARPLYSYAHKIEDALNRNGGEAELLAKLYDDTSMMQVFLQDTGKEKVQPVEKETVTKISEAEAETNQFLVNTLGTDMIAGFKIPAGENPITYRRAYMDAHETEIRDAYAKLCEEVYGFTAEEIENVLNNTDKRTFMKIMRDAYMYTQNNGVTVKKETDYEATKEAIRNSAKDGYKEWVDNLFKGVEEKTGIRNNADVFTRSKNIRSWDALHWENTLENVVKVMKRQDNGQALFGGAGIWGVSAKEYKNIEEIKSDSDRLMKMSDDEYQKIKESYKDRLSAIASRIMSKTEINQFIAIDDAMSAIVDSVRVSKTPRSIFKELQQHGNLNVTEKDAADIVSLVKDISNMPTGYFEAKPQRAVRLDEVGVFVIPYDTDAKLKQELLNKGYSIAEYNPEVEGDRKRVVNQFEEYKFRIADDIPTKAYGNHIYSKDLKVVGNTEIAPTTEESLPITEENVEVPNEYMSAEPGIAPVGNATEGVSETNDSIVPEKKVEVAPAQQNKENSENKEIKTVAERLEAQREAVQTELENSVRLRSEAASEFETEIAELQQEYDSKKNKTTKLANNILLRIERLKRMKTTVDAGYEKRINDLKAKGEKMDTPQYKTAMQRKAKQENYQAQMADLVGDTSTWVDKNLGIQYKTNTLRRNLRDIVRDADGKRDIAKADAIYDEIQGKYNHNEAELKRESRKIKGKYAEFHITKAEDKYIQMLGEFKYNPDTHLKSTDMEKYYEKNKKNINVEKVERIIEEARKTYDTLLIRVNDVLREQGMKEIPYRQGYFPHFTEDKQNFLARLLNWKTINTEIPTDIAGLTEMFKPNRSWQSFNKQRKSDATDYSFTKGLDTYVHGALDWIYHIEDIQKRRALENHLRYIHSEQGIKDKIEAIKNSEEYDAEEAQEQIELAYKEAANPLQNFVKDLQDGTNTLANKKSALDRSAENLLNRKVYSTMTNLSNRVTANQVAGSISSALTNFIPITQSWMQVSPVRSLQAMRDTIRSTHRDDGVINKSDFLTNRLKPEENIYKTNWDNISEKVGFLMEAVDSFSSQVVWRSKYIDNLSKGMSENAAIKDADQFAENVIAGRSRGNMPTIFDSKNPLIKTLTAFQLEVANQYGYMFKDAPQDMKSEGVVRLAAGYTTMFFGAYAYNALYSSLTGRDAAFDPARIIGELLSDLFGDDEEGPAEAIMDLADNILEETPFIGGVLGGGRIPISSAFPYGDNIYDVLKGTVTDISDKDIKGFTKEWLNPVYYLVMPIGGGQIRKSAQGVGMFLGDHPIDGSYTDSGALRFPVEKTPGNVAKALVFGQWSSKNARDYIENERSPLQEKAIEEFIEVDLPISEYWEYREGLKGLKTLSDKADYINSLDLPIEKKNILVNNQTDRKDPIDLTGFDESYENFEEFDFATKNPDKYEIALQVGGYEAYKTYKEGMKKMKLAEKADYVSKLDLTIEQKNALINGETDRKEPIDLTGYENYNSFEEFEMSKENPAKYSAAKIIGFEVYTKYMEELGEIHADKDAEGNSISGSAKKKKLEYINRLNIDYGQKIILYRSLFDSKEDKNAYNRDIIDYLNSRNDVSYEEMVEILESLDMKVYPDGSVDW